MCCAAKLSLLSKICFSPPSVTSCEMTPPNTNAFDWHMLFPWWHRQWPSGGRHGEAKSDKTWVTLPVSHQVFACALRGVIRLAYECVPASELLWHVLWGLSFLLRSLMQQRHLSWSSVFDQRLIRPGILEALCHCCVAERWDIEVLVNA